MMSPAHHAAIALPTTKIMASSARLALAGMVIACLHCVACNPGQRTSAGHHHPLTGPAAGRSLCTHVGLKSQDEPCDTDGERFLPVPVEFVLSDPQITLKQAEGGGSLDKGAVFSRDRLLQICTANDAADLDLPGTPRSPGCNHKQWFDARLQIGFGPTVYSRVKANGFDLLAVQTWFHYVYGDFNESTRATGKRCNWCGTRRRLRSPSRSRVTPCWSSMKTRSRR